MELGCKVGEFQLKPFIKCKKKKAGVEVNMPLWDGHGTVQTTKNLKVPNKENKIVKRRGETLLSKTSSLSPYPRNVSL